MKRFFARLNPIRPIKKVYYYYKRHGLRRTLRRLFGTLKLRFHFGWRKVYSKKQIKAQREATFSRDICISILVPLYNTPISFLREMIASVQAQTYANWQLCMADGSDAQHSEVGEVASEYAQNDTRICYRKLAQNGGISANTNACAEMAKGQYLALFDHDDLLHPSALYDIMCAICDQGADFIYTDEATFTHSPRDAYSPNFKPDFAPDTLRSYNYICHLSAFSRELFDRVGGFRPAFDGSQDYDLILRLTEVAQKVVHIPHLLYYWRCHQASVSFDISAKPYTVTSALAALNEHLARVGLQGKAQESAVPSTYRIRYALPCAPRISIIIPNKDHTDLLDACIRSVLEKSTYPNYEILIVENNSTEEATFAYYDRITQAHDCIKVLRYAGGFNYSAINNFAIAQAQGEHLILLNNDMEIITPDWMEELLSYTQRSDVGACGMMLYYPDDTVQHAGVILGIGGVAGHAHKDARRDDYGYAYRLTVAQNLSAVTAACMMVKKAVFEEIGGFDTSLAVAFNDVDLCLAMRKAGYLIVFTPYAQAYHYESKSRGSEDTREKAERFRSEVERFHQKWEDVLQAGDPYYNPNLTLDSEDFRLK